MPRTGGSPTARPHPRSALGLSFPSCAVGTSVASQTCHQHLAQAWETPTQHGMLVGYHRGWAPWTRGAPQAPPSVWANPGLLGPHASPLPSGGLARGRAQLPPLPATLSGLGASCIWHRRRRVGRLVTPRALCAAFLCLPTLRPGEWEPQRVCCVNTSWSPVTEIAEVSGPSLSRRVGQLQPVTHPSTRRTARPGWAAVWNQPGQPPEGAGLRRVRTVSTRPSSGTSEQKRPSGL